MFKLTARAGFLLLPPPPSPSNSGRRGDLRRRSRWQVATAIEAAPPATAYDKSTPLIDLPILSLDTEATGLDPGSDRIVAIAAAHLQQGKLYLAEALDLLIDPGQPIPPAVIALHGISDAWVADAIKFVDLAEQLDNRLEGFVLLGHNVHYDAALLHHEMRRSGRQWQRPPLLDTLLLYASLYPTAGDLTLDAVAKRFRISRAGRHTALGDALIALDVYFRLLPHLAAKGILTLGQAETASSQALERLRHLSRQA
ncbi:MAG: 3'-5' exonuclease [Dongiaceae bacterium]